MKSDDGGSAAAVGGGGGIVFSEKRGERKGCVGCSRWIVTREPIFVRSSKTKAQLSMEWVFSRQTNDFFFYGVMVRVQLLLLGVSCRTLVGKDMNEGRDEYK